MKFKNLASLLRKKPKEKKKIKAVDDKTLECDNPNCKIPLEIAMTYWEGNVAYDPLEGKVYHEGGCELHTPLYMTIYEGVYFSPIKDITFEKAVELYNSGKLQQGKKA